MPIFEMISHVPLAPREVYDWHRRPYAFHRVMAPWEKTKSSVVAHEFKNGGRLEFEFCLGPIHVPWLAEYQDVIDGQQFVDVQLRGPFPYWRHTHRFDADASGTKVIDRVEYGLPGGKLGELFAGRYAHERLVKMFRYRHGILTRDLAALPKQKLRIAVTGASGLIGSALVSLLATQGHEVIQFVRDPKNVKPYEKYWNPAQGILKAEDVEGLDALVHLGGEGVANGRWTQTKKERILQSRIQSTELLVETFKKLKHPPRAFICASAVGYYGNGADAELTELSFSGEGFLADVCRKWEAAASGHLPSSIRPILLRIGIVLSPKGGALATMLPIFRMGFGSPLGSGKGFMPWVTIDDTVSMIAHAIPNEEIHGAMNVVAPNPLRNREFSKTLSQVLHRPMLPAVPGPVLRVMVGELADALLLSSLRVVPTKAIASGYKFHHPTLKEGLQWLLGKTV